MSDDELREGLTVLRDQLNEALYPAPAPGYRGGYVPCEGCEGAGKVWDGG